MGFEQYDRKRVTKLPKNQVFFDKRNLVFSRETWRECFKESPKLCFYFDSANNFIGIKPDNSPKANKIVIHSNAIRMSFQGFLNHYHLKPKRGKLFRLTEFKDMYVFKIEEIE